MVKERVAGRIVKGTRVRLKRNYIRTERPRKTAKVLEIRTDGPWDWEQVVLDSDLEGESSWFKFAVERVTSFN